MSLSNLFYLSKSTRNSTFSIEQFVPLLLVHKQLLASKLFTFCNSRKRDLAINNTKLIVIEITSIAYRMLGLFIPELHLIAN